MDECFICESKNLKEIFSKEDFSYFRCSSCGMLLVDLNLARAEVFSHYSESYYEGDSTGTSRNRSGYPSYRGAQDTLNASFKDKMNLVRKYVPSGRLLDAGAAYGLFLKVASSFFEGTGLDVSEYAAFVARTEFGMNVHAGDIEHTTFPDEYFDVVVLWDIIEHLIRPVEALREVKRILRPGGYVFISTDNAANWLPRMLGSRWWALAPPMHLCHFSKEGMKIALQKAGIEFHSFNTDPRRYSFAEIIKHFGVSYKNQFLTEFGTRLEQTTIGKFVFHVTRPEQFVAIGRKPGKAI